MTKSELKTTKNGINPCRILTSSVTYVSTYKICLGLFRFHELKKSIFPPVVAH